MRYLLAVLVPPVAVLVCGKPFQALANLGLTLLGWVPGAVHACLVVHDHQEDRRQERLIEALRRT